MNSVRAPASQPRPPTPLHPEIRGATFSFWGQMSWSCGRRGCENEARKGGVSSLQRCPWARMAPLLLHVPGAGGCTSPSPSSCPRWRDPGLAEGSDGASFSPSQTLISY